MDETLAIILYAWLSFNTLISIILIDLVRDTREKMRHLNKEVNEIDRNFKRCFNSGISNCDVPVNGMVFHEERRNHDKSIE